MDQIKIGAFLRELRKEKGLTQEQLAEEFNVSRRSVSRWETGSNLPDLDLLLELADHTRWSCGSSSTASGTAKSPARSWRKPSARWPNTAARAS